MKIIIKKRSIASRERELILIKLLILARGSSINLYPRPPTQLLAQKHLSRARILAIAIIRSRGANNNIFRRYREEVKFSKGLPGAPLLYLCVCVYVRTYISVCASVKTCLCVCVCARGYLSRGSKRAS